MSRWVVARGWPERREISDNDNRGCAMSNALKMDSTREVTDVPGRLVRPAI
jgi:hypothetical protein